MAAEARAGGERAFEIHEIAGLFLAEGSAPQRFAGKVGGEMIWVEFDHGEAAAVDGDAVAEFHFGRDRTGAPRGSRGDGRRRRRARAIQFFRRLQ